MTRLSYHANSKGHYSIDHQTGNLACCARVAWISQDLRRMTEDPGVIRREAE